ncbi:HAMP domain-containing histidine kinase [Croceibacterium sp. LX-88]|uniref:histidine kinase n=1 Tax=Croceibacterium selenioxidans TaxID=2838833 RepID=A0ABS5W897_9SPHN|nr:HAMP domain-containing histidine kinase [Croceibacterium selenioxidans]
MVTEPRKPTHAAAFRGALWITLIALLTTSIALTVQYVQTSRYLDEKTQGLLDDETASLVERFEVGGPVELAAFLRRQQALSRLNEFFYLLAAPDGTPLVGNLTAWPGEVDQPGFKRFSTNVISADGTVHARTVMTRAVLLDGGYRLLVGQIAESGIALRDRYLVALFWSLVITGLLGLLLGWLLSRRALAFVEKVSTTGTRFLAGNLEERVPLSGHDDEYERLAETINACFVEIEHVVRSLRAATDGMAHDLKTPLTRISARLELAEMRGASAGELRQIIADSRNDLAGLLRIIEDMLNLARAEATTSVSFADVDLAAIAADAVELYQPVAEDKGVALELRSTPASVRGAPALLGQLVVNLIDNAVKYSPSGASVEVAIERQGDSAVLTVSDQGPGIPPDRRADVLSRFVRLDESRGMPGVGIGLSIVAAAARVHRAALDLQDNNPGLRVVVRFPLSDPQEVVPD